MKVFWPKCISGIIYNFSFYYEKIFKIVKKIFYLIYVHLSENTFIHCSRISVVRIHENIFLQEFTQRVTVAQTEKKTHIETKHD